MANKGCRGARMQMGGLIACALAVGGCGGLGGGGADAPGVDGAAVDGEKLQALVSAGPLDAQRLAMNVARELRFQGRDPTKALVINRDAPPDCHCAGRTWWVRRFDPNKPGAASAGKARLEQKFIIDNSGSVAIAEQIDRGEEVEVVFTPAMVVMPDKLPAVSAGQARFTQELTMVVHPLGNRAKVKASGKVQRVIEYVGDEAIATGAGVMQARKLHTTFDADLGPARVSQSSDQWFVEDVGLVQEFERETTKVLGLTTRDNRGAWTLESFVPR